jgi:hypothetical protein
MLRIEDAERLQVRIGGLGGGSLCRGEKKKEKKKAFLALCGLRNAGYFINLKINFSKYINFNFYWNY